ncbi:MAG: (E)-4-hydroxy-3-methylbut-2-enyl-diphosphate synthase [Parachlamydiales bacterium]|nr:(E)-4-hydroxy-3-methylbut-2-enyl-diphosphate synthase [Parachlamydiales bacterium]
MMNLKKSFITREVVVGSVPVGGNNPVRIQSMTNTNTNNVAATVDQIMHLADGGCEIVRLAVQGKKEAYSCENIKNILLRKGYTIPLVADVHFYPLAALIAAEFVDKVRINPGNYCRDTKQHPLEGIDEKIGPFLALCSKRNVAVRIGVNYGSLSPRIEALYGNSFEGMVASALEFGKILRNHHFHNFFFSLKASDTSIMIKAYQKLVLEMLDCGWDYPLHVGVTEAGEGLEGRIHSAIGIGTLLLQGIGDTIRVSLTEDPFNEISPCQELCQLYKSYYSSTKRVVHRSSLFRASIIDPQLFFMIDDQNLDSLLQDHLSYPFGIFTSKKLFKDRNMETMNKEWTNCFFTEEIEDNHACNLKNPSSICKISTLEEIHKAECFWNNKKMILVDVAEKPLFFLRKCRDYLSKSNIGLPVFLLYGVQDKSILQIGGELGSILVEGLVDGFVIQSSKISPVAEIFSHLFYSFSSHKKARVISCPGCGRTLYDIQTLTKKVKEKMKSCHGITVAVMGCVVNGLREMGDADIGLLGSKKDHVDLYKKGVLIQKNIPVIHADSILWKCYLKEKKIV